MINFKGAYLTERTFKVEPSVAEKRIMKVLDNIGIEYFREVSFKGLKSKKGYELYFDFVIPSLNIIIEYDGSHHLTDESIKENDIIKNKFAFNNKIKLHRFDSRDWTSLKRVIGKIVTMSISPVKSEVKKNVKKGRPDIGLKHRKKWYREQGRKRALEIKEKEKMK